MKIELVVFGIIAIFLVLASLTVPLPALSKNSSSLPVLGKAPELAGTQGWINSEPLTLTSLRGKVVLADFWTYSCINCIRTLPYLNSWHEKYASSGLVILGVHTPEFAFEKDYVNVKAAVEKYGIRYAVVQDNDYATWRAYRNNYWPRKYLIDKDGNIRYDHIGEGAYEETEEAIQQLLREITAAVPTEKTATPSEERLVGTPELYLGHRFIRTPLGNPEGLSPGKATAYKQIPAAAPNTVYLSGTWESRPDNVVAAGQAGLALLYTAKEVNIVAGGQATLKVRLDGKPLPESSFGIDASAGGAVTVAETRLYNIISAPQPGTHLLEMDASPGLELYTFTFG